MTWTTFTCTLRHLLGWWGFDPWSPNPKPKFYRDGWLEVWPREIKLVLRDEMPVTARMTMRNSVRWRYAIDGPRGGAGWTYREHFSTGVRSNQCCWGVKYMPSAFWSTGWSTIRRICLQLSREAIVSKLNVPQRISSQKLVRQLLSLPVIVPTYPDSEFFTIGWD